VWRTEVHRTSGFRRSGIDKVRVRHLVKPRVAIPRESIRIVHLWDKCQGIGRCRSFVHRESAYRGFKDMKPLHYKTPICDIPVPSQAVDTRDTWRASGEDRGLEYREPWVQVFCVIANAETPMEGYTTTVI
jgi:hypothetical protein